jgi:CheY-like chemotaxis protein
VTVEVGEVTFADLHDYVARTFQHVAEEKGLRFDVELDASLPRGLQTDAKRLQQILKNLLANAFKFTERGAVSFKLGTATAGWTPDHPVLRTARPVVCMAVTDTGIGIEREKQQIIFEAFQQAQGGSSRKYGGTGLGLAISRELARLLGGEIKLVSTPGQGSTFTLYLPLSYVPSRLARMEPARTELSREERLERERQAAWPAIGAPAAPPRAMAEPVTWAGDVTDDRTFIQPGDRVVLIIEDDPAFSRFLMDLAHDQGLKALVAARGANGLALARELKPHAITLDISLPDVDGWRVLDRLKDDPATRHIPVYMISVTDEPERSLQHGALGFLHKPADKDALSEVLSTVKSFVERQVKNLLVVEDDEIQRSSMVELIGNGDVKITAVATGQEALDALESQHFDCMVIDLLLPDVPGLEVIQRIKKQPTLRSLPIVVYTAKDLSREEETQLKRLSQTIILKDVKSPERLLDETALFLHRNTANLPEAKREILERLHRSDSVLAGKRVLIVDDDIRNIFAMTSVLERHKMEVVAAESGKDALEQLEKTPNPDIVLMDIMLPEMDGYETTRQIREKPQFKSLPIIALTAKAMKGDREKCIEAGASDYIAKPVDTEQLLSLLRVWLYR